MERMFKTQTRLNHDTFRVLVTVLTLSFQKQNTYLKSCIDVKTCVVLFFIQPNSGNTLDSSKEPFGILGILLLF